jgi:hypothetical protein
MSPSIKQKAAIPVFLVPLLLACFAILRSAQAAQPSDNANVNVFNTPFQRVIVVSIDRGSLDNSQTIAIPAGKTLVVEFVSAIVNLPAGEQVTRLGLATRGIGLGNVDLLPNFLASENDRDFFVASLQIRLYAKDELVASVSRDVGAGAGQANVNVIGYFVNTP